MRKRFGIVALLVFTLCACTESGFAPPAIIIERDPLSIRVRSGDLTASVRREPYRLEIRSGNDLRTAEVNRGGPFYERAGAVHTITSVVSDRDLPNGVELTVATTEGITGTVTLRFLAAKTIEITIDPPDPAGVTALGDRFDSPADERIYGLTERLRDSPPVSPPTIEIPLEDLRPVEVGSLDRRGEMIDMLVRPTIALYAPFFHSSRGYGLSVDGTAIGVFDIAASHPEVVRFRFETGNAPESRRLRFYIFDGPEHGTILDEYTRLVGRPFVPPDWAFLHWRWRGELPRDATAELDGTTLNADVVEDVQMYEALGIPPGVYLLDRPVLEGEFGFARFTWDQQRVPNPDAMLSALRQRGYRIVMWSSLWACGSTSADNGSEALALGFLAPFANPEQPPMCGDARASNFILDPTNPAMRTWWVDKLANFAARYELDGIKLDRGEEHIPTEASDVWFDGRNGREVRNDYPTLQAQIHHDAMQHARASDDFLVITRSGYTGTTQWAITWGGDIAGSETAGLGPSTDLGLRSAIIAQLRAAFMGYPIWGSDTGGYYQFKDRDVFARWLEFSAFSGIMEIGGTNGPHAPWDMPTEPSYDQELIDIYRRYTTLREELQPYLVDAAAEAGRSGMPIVRPLVFAFRDDPAVHDMWDQYMFGPDLMVAPVWKAGARARAVYFPAGRWQSFWDESQTYAGPATVTVDVPLDTIPVYRRQ